MIKINNKSGPSLLPMRAVLWFLVGPSMDAWIYYDSPRAVHLNCMSLPLFLFSDWALAVLIISCRSHSGDNHRGGSQARGREAGDLLSSLPSSQIAGR